MPQPPTYNNPVLNGPGWAAGLPIPGTTLTLSDSITLITPLPIDRTHNALTLTEIALTLTQIALESGKLDRVEEVKHDLTLNIASIRVSVRVGVRDVVGVRVTWG